MTTERSAGSSVALALSPELVDGIRTVLEAGRAYCLRPEVVETVQQLAEAHARFAAFTASTEFLQVARTVTDGLGAMVGMLQSVGEAYPWLLDVQAARLNLARVEASLHSPMLPTPPVEVVDCETRAPAPSLLVDIRCAGCEGTLTLRAETTDAGLSVRIVPLCKTCQERWSDDGDYMSRLFAEFHGPSLRLVPGGGQGSGEPAGVLHLLSPLDEG